MTSPWNREQSRRLLVAGVTLVLGAATVRAAPPPTTTASSAPSSPPSAPSSGAPRPSIPDKKDPPVVNLDDSISIMKAAVPVARAALPRLATLAQIAPAQIGFDTPGMPQHAELASPLREYTLPLSQLRLLGSGTSMMPVTPLRPSQRVLFPVLVVGRAASSITVGTTKGGEIKAVEYGSPKLIRLIERTATVLAQPLDQRVKDPGVELPPPPELPGPPLPQLGNVGHDYFLVRVPALNICVLGERSGSALFLTPMLDDPRVGFRAGITQRAEPGLLALARLAQTTKTDKPR